MTKKQHKEIARMWVAGLTDALGLDSFDMGIAYKDQKAILRETEKLRDRLLGTRPYLPTLPMIIGYVSANKR